MLFFLNFLSGLWSLLSAWLKSWFFHLRFFFNLILLWSPHIKEFDTENHCGSTWDSSSPFIAISIVRVNHNLGSFSNFHAHDTDFPSWNYSSNSNREGEWFSSFIRRIKEGAILKKSSFIMNYDNIFWLWTHSLLTSCEFLLKYSRVWSQNLNFIFHSLFWLWFGLLDFTNFKKLNEEK